MKTKRLTAGLYTVSDGDLVVGVEHRLDLKGWMAVADWDRLLYSSVLATKAEAVRCARAMIINEHRIDAVIAGRRKTRNA